MPSEEQLAEDGLRLDGALQWRITVRNTGGDDDLIAEGEVSGTALVECRRCLVDVEAPVASSFLYPMTYRPGKHAALHLIEAPLAGEVSDVDPADDAGEDRLAFGRPEVDFGPLLRQVFAIDLPLTVLCKAGCRGLSIDGVDLNEHPDHVPATPAGPTDQGEAASPFAVLKDLDLESRS